MANWNASNLVCPAFKAETAESTKLGQAALALLAALNLTPERTSKWRAIRPKLRANPRIR
jgi:hypothetical protein